MEKKAFVDELFSACSQARTQDSVQTRVLVTAHGAYESGWGKAKAASSFNYWNLTAGSAWKGPIIKGGDTEFTAGRGVPKAIVQSFRAYPDPISAVHDYFKFLEFPRYKDALVKLRNGDETFVVDLGLYKYTHDGKMIEMAWPAQPPKGGFYTLPIPRYSTEFYAVLKSVKSLLQVC